MLCHCTWYVDGNHYQRVILVAVIIMCQDTSAILLYAFSFAVVDVAGAHQSRYVCLGRDGQARMLEESVRRGCGVVALFFLVLGLKSFLVFYPTRSLQCAVCACVVCGRISVAPTFFGLLFFFNS